jgi:LytR cell envelope-related transcriptional attenuator
VGTSTLRFAIIVALVAGGVLLISRSPQDATATLSSGTRSPNPTESATGSGQTTGGGGQTATGGGEGATTGGGQSTPSPQVQGVKLAVYNGTYETGLASGAADELRQLGYKINADTSVTDAQTKPVDQTTLYYVSRDDKIEADALANDFFKDFDVKIQKLPDELSPVPDGVQVAVYLGTDYAGALG